MLGIVIGLESFHRYTYRRSINVESDRNPLQSIVKKTSGTQATLTNGALATAVRL